MCVCIPVEARIRVRRAWQDQQPTYWVLRDGEWYLGDEKELADLR